MNDIIISDVAHCDLEVILQLNQANLPHVGSVSLTHMQYLFDRAIYFREATSGDNIAGFLIAFDKRSDYKSPNYLWFKKHYENFIYIDRIIIASTYRRRGIALALYKNLEELACERQVPIMACEYNLHPNNETSRICHRQYGFGEVGRQETEGGKKTVSLQIKQIE